MVAFYFAAGGRSMHGLTVASHNMANRRSHRSIPRRSVPLRDDLHLPGVAEPHALGADTLTLAKIQMDHPAVGGRHGFQGDAAAGLRDAIRDAVRHLTQRVLASLAVLLHIQRDADVFVKLLPHDALDDELQRMQGIAPPSNQEPGVGAVDVDHGAASQLVVLGAQGHVDVGADGGEDALNGLHGGTGRRVGRYGQHRSGRIVHSRLVHLVRFIGLVIVGIRLGTLRRSGRRGPDARNANLGQFTANTQKALAASI